MIEKKVPEVRFKGFSGEWVSDALGEITDVYDGTHQTPKYTESGIMFLSVENIQTLQSEKYISEDDFINNFKIYPQKNDVLMTRIGDVGTANVVDCDAKKAYYVSLALLKYKKLNPFFLMESIHSQTVKREIWHRTLHIAFPKKINKNEIEKVNMLFPNEIKEQNKIGEFFENLDNLIAQNQKKYDKLVNMKKACLGKMFPKDGADTPEVRFEGFSAKWEQYNWGDTIDISTNMVDPRTGEFDELPHIGPGNIEAFYGTLMNNVKSVREDCLISGKFHFYEGDIIYGKINPQLAKYVIAPYEGLSSADTYILNSKNGIEQLFLFSILHTENFFKYTISVSMRSGMPKINRDELSVYNFFAPLFDEQTKIGTFFQTIDNLIVLQKTKLEKLKNIKKACLDKMFI